MCWLQPLPSPTLFISHSPAADSPFYCQSLSSSQGSENCSHTPTQQRLWRKLSRATLLKYRHFKPLWSLSNNRGEKNPKQQKPKKKKKSQTKLLTGALTTTKERMPLKGESHFFLLDFFIFQYPSRSLPLFFPPHSPVPSPTTTPGELGRRSFHAGAQTFYFQRKPASEGDGSRAAAARSSGQPAGSAPAQVRLNLSESS